MAMIRLTPLVRLRALLVKEFRQILRDPRMRFFVVIPPLMQLMIFGYAASLDVRQADIGIVDQAKTPTTRAFLAAVTADGRLHPHFFPDVKSAATAMDHNEIRVILHFGPDFSRQPAAQLISDGADPNSAQLVLGQVKQALARTSLAAGQVPVLRLEEQAWFNPNLDDRPFFVPGIVANVVLIATLTLTAMAVVRERELGTLERLQVTPVGRLEILIGKLTPVACVGLFDVALVSTVAVFFFKVPFHGSLLTLLLASLLFLSSSLGLGLLISSYARTQQQAVLLSFFMIMPFVLLSGFAFPIQNMPDWVQWLTYLDPLRYFQVVIRDLFLRGGGIAEHQEELVIMASLGAGALALALPRLR